ncbi:hypothetical protein BH11BAC2_BH11BAC2_18070 [soil metagenome]
MKSTKEIFEKTISFYEAILKNSLDIITVTDINAVILFRSSSSERLTGWKADELLGKNLLDFVVQEDAQLFQEIMQKVLHHSGIPIFISFNGVHKDGSIIQLEGTICNNLDDGSVKGILFNLKPRNNLLDQTSEIIRANKEFYDFKCALDEASIVAITDKHGIIQHANDNFCRVSKYSREELIGQDHRLVNSGYHSKEFIYELWTTISKGENWRGEFKNKAKDGTFYWVYTTIIPFLDKMKQPYQYVSIKFDITDRKKLEEEVLQLNEGLELKVIERTRELENSKAELTKMLDKVSFLASITENIQDPIISADNNFIITKWNNAAEKLLGWKSEEVIGEPISEILKTQFNFDSPEEIQKTLTLSDYWQGELVYFTKVGEKLNVLTTVSTLKNMGGKNVGSLFLVKDITARKSAEEAILKLNMELEERVVERTQEINKREKRYRALIENSNDVISLMDEEFNVVYRSPSAARITGWEDGDLLHFSAIRNVHPEDLEIVKDLIVDLRTNPGKQINCLFRNQHKAGHYLWLEGVAINLLNDENIKGFVFNFRDITSRKQAEEEKELFTSIVNFSDDAIISKNLKGIITSWNHGAELVFGYKNEEVVGKHISILIPLHLQHEEVEIINKIRMGQYVDHYETERVRKDGKIINVTLTVSPLKNSAGKIVGASKISRDVTEKKKVEKELSKNVAELERSNKELEQFAYIASHDLQEPLRMVGSYMQLIERRYKGKLDTEADEFIHYAVDGANRMKQLISDLLNYSRMNTPGTIIPVDLNTVLEEILKNLTKSFSESGAKFQSEKLPVIEADRTQMIQLFQNLISNAIKFRREGISPEISLTAVKKEGEWLFSIADNGIGIDQQYADRVFIVFKQLHTKAKYGGTGIGLAIAKKIVERHGGSIWFDSVSGKGTTFNFTLSAK